MKRNISHPVSVLILMLAIPSGRVAAQTSEQMVTMVKNMISQFQEFTAEDINNEDIIEGSAVLEPGFELNDKNLYIARLSEPQEMFSLGDYENGYAIVDEKEFPTNAVNLVFSFTELPGFTLLNSWYDLHSFEDAGGKDLLLSDKELEKYMDLGIIRDDFNYPVPGEFSTRLWLKRELEYEEPLKAGGVLSLEYPSSYEQAAFSAPDAGTRKAVGTTELTLIAMDRNMATFLIKGNRRDVEGLKMLILNKEGRQFSGVNSMAIDADMYDFENQTVRTLSDEEIGASVKGFDMSDMHVEQVKKIKVYGNMERIVFLKVDGYDPLEIPFTVKVSYNGF